MRHFTFVSATALCLLLAAPVCSLASEDGWTKVQSKNFLLVGNASERDIRHVAIRLEQFRAVCWRLLTGDHFDSSTPTIVFVFRDDSAYGPFKPLYQGRPADVAGYFQASPEVDYITLSVDRPSGKSLSSLVFHEYVHLLVKNGFRGAPLWFKEGLAEYYSTSEMLNGNRKIRLGRQLNNRLMALRNRKLMPLAMLLEVDYYSAEYHEPDKRSLFYAESWALVHYLLSNRGGERRPQLSRYLELLAAGTSVKDSFRQAFQTDYVTLENELSEYIRHARYQEQIVTFDERLEFNAEMQSIPMTEAETSVYLGDLLLRTDRHYRAESFLERAIALDPNLAIARTSFGFLRLRQNRFSEAKQHLERAIAADPQNYLAHYYYAAALSHEGVGRDDSISGYIETTRVMHTELKKAIELAPEFVEAYRLLAQVELERGTQVDEAIALLKHALALAPRRKEFLLLLAQLYLRKEEFGTARAILHLLTAENADPRLRAEARTLIETVASREETASRHKDPNDDTHAEFASNIRSQPCDMPQPGPQLKKLRFVGEQVCGQLLSIDCTDMGVVLLIEAGSRTFRLRSTALNRIKFVTYTTEVRGRIECGMRSSANPVLVTYRAPKEAFAEMDGEVVAVEFVPREWNH